MLAAAFPGLGIGFAGVALAFGLTVLTMAFAIGHISGCHLNPAVSVGLVVARRFPVSELPAYVIAQVLGGIAGSGVLYLIASGKEGFSLASGFAANGYGEHSPGGYALGACLTAEVVLTFMFLMIILGATDKRAPQGFRADRDWAGADADPPDRYPGDQPSVNPARSTAPGDFRGRMGALEQLWLFWVAPIVGAAMAGAVYTVFETKPEPMVREALSRLKLGPLATRALSALRPRYSVPAETRGRVGQSGRLSAVDYASRGSGRASDGGPRWG